MAIHVDMYKSSDGKLHESRLDAEEHDLDLIRKELDCFLESNIPEYRNFYSKQKTDIILALTASFTDAKNVLNIFNKRLECDKKRLE